MVNAAFLNASTSVEDKKRKLSLGGREYPRIWLGAGKDVYRCPVKSLSNHGCHFVRALTK